MSDMVFPGCPECEYQPRFVSVPIAELEELIKALESTAVALRNSPLFGTLNPMGKASAYADHIAAKFRAKHLQE